MAPKVPEHPQPARTACDTQVSRHAVLVLDSVFLQVLGATGSLPTDVLRSAYICATETKSERLLVALAARSDLPSDMDAEISAMPGAKIRSAWLSRLGRTAEELEQHIKKEKRATVLAAVASSELATPDVLIQISTDSRRVVAEAILTNEKAPKEAHHNAVLGVIAEYENLPYRLRALVRQRAVEEEGPARGDFMLAATGQILRELITGSQELTPDMYRHALERLVKAQITGHQEKQDYRAQYVFDQAYQRAAELIERSPDDACVKETYELLKAGPTSYHRKAFLAAYELVKDGLAERTTRAERAVSTTDVAVISELTVYARDRHDTKLAVLILQNPFTPEDDFRSLASFNVGAAIDAAISRKDARLAAAVLRFVYANTAELTCALEYFGAPLVELLEADYRLESVISSNESLHHLADVYVRVIPLKDLVRNSYSTLDPVMAAAVARQLATIPPEGFRFAAAMQQGWEGSLTELLSAVEAVVE